MLLFKIHGACGKIDGERFLSGTLMKPGAKGSGWEAGLRPGSQAQQVLWGGALPFINLSRERREGGGPPGCWHCTALDQTNHGKEERARVSIWSLCKFKPQSHDLEVE